MTPEGLRALAHGAAILAAGHQQRHCQWGGGSRKRDRRQRDRHPHTLTEADATRPLICDICGANIAPGAPTASCRGCDYDECRGCFDAARSLEDAAQVALPEYHAAEGVADSGGAALALAGGGTAAGFAAAEPAAHGEPT